ncbi:MAG: cytochrome c biogenesis protein ResB [Desulfobacteraceae bacterium]
MTFSDTVLERVLITMKESNTEKRPNAIWNIFSSIKLTLVLLILLAITSIFGTLIPQQEGAMAFAQRLSPGLVNLLSSLQLFDMYHSVWFRLLIGSLALNLVVCSIDRFPTSMKRFRARPKPDRFKPFKNLASQRSFSLKEEMTETSDRVAQILKAQYRRLETKITDTGHFFYADKGRYSHFGVYLVHLSVLLILIGGIIGSFFGFEAYVNIPEGEAVETVRLRKTRAPKTLPFTVRCEKFTVDFYENGAPKEYRSDLIFIADGKAVQHGALLVNHPITFNGITFYQSSYGTLPGNRVRLHISGELNSENAFFDAEVGTRYQLPGNEAQFLVRDIRPNFMRMGPAVQIMIKPAEGEDITFWVFQNEAQIRNRFPGIFQKFPKLNPSAFKPYTFFLDEIESRYYTGLQVNKDPGVSLVWLGFFVIILGLFVTFFMSHRRVWVHISNTSQGITVSVAGKANKNPVGLEKELDQLTERLRTQLKERSSR